MYIRLRTQMKRICLNHSVQSLLLSAHLVLHWQGRPNPNENSSSESQDSSGPRAIQNFWTFIPLHYERPWAPTLLVMEMKPDSQAHFSMRSPLSADTMPSADDYFELQPKRAHAAFEFATIMSGLGPWTNH